MHRPLLHLTLFLLSAPSTVQAFIPQITQQAVLHQRNSIATNSHTVRRHLHPHRTPQRRALFPTRLNLSSSSSDLPEPSSMRVKELRAELQSYGISTKSFFEKSELVEAVEKARSEGKTVAAEGGDVGAAGGGDNTDGGTASPTPPSSSSSTGNRASQLAKEMERCNSMKVSELKSELASYGISTKSFFEKSEFVKACAEARVDGASGGGTKGAQGGAKQEKFDPSYRDVVMQKMSKDQAMEMGFGGGGWGASKTSVIDVRLG